MTIRHLKIFIEVAKSSNMSLAAEKLFVSQPTVSQTIRELESHYGVKLFERLSKKLYITEFGKQLYIYAKQVVDQFDNLEKRMSENIHTENLRIGASLTVGTYLLSKILKDFNQSCPNVHTYSYVNNTSNIEKKLLKSELDVAIVEGDIQSSDLISIPVIDDYLVLLCSNNHAFATKKEIELKDLENQRFAMREDGSGTRAYLEDFLEKHDINVQIVWEASSTDTIKRAILDDNCLSLLSIHTFKEDILNGKIHIINSKYLDKLKRSFKFVYHKDKIMTSSIKALEETIKQYKSPDYIDNYLV